MEKRKIKVVINKKGNYTLEALDGFVGQSCREKTRDLEILLGGEYQSSENTKRYYDDDGNNDINLDLGL